ncbi:hypothetical protein KW803_00350 [Candidatus Saccharibacteria bacterium]|nr:hypothetical protein [Candidatus Saccharibacteria bacterium]
MSETIYSNYGHLHAAFAETEYGQHLSQQTRWERYKPAGVSPQRWRELLGVDVNNLGHLQLSGNLTRVFIGEMDKSRPGYFNLEDKIVLEVAAYTHDWPESIVGDTNYHLKSTIHDDEEKAVFIQNLKAFYPDCSPEMEIIINRAVEEVIYAHDGEGLARAFNVIERVGYVRTALRATDKVVHGTASDCESSMRQLVGDAFSVHISALMGLTDEFPPVEQYLRNQHELISAGFGLVDEEAFANLHSDGVRAKFQNALLAWTAWSGSNSHQ